MLLTWAICFWICSKIESRTRFLLNPHRPVHFPKKSNPRFDRETPDVVYGKNSVTELLRAKRRRVLEISVARVPERASATSEAWSTLANEHRVPLRVCEERELERLAGSTHHQGVVARVAPYIFADFEKTLTGLGNKALLVILDCVQDPQNFGTLCRSALAFGADAIILPKDRSVSVTPTVCKASAGAVEHLNIIQVGNLVIAMHKLKEAGYWIYGAHLDLATTTLAELDPAGRSVLVLGSEGRGLRELVAKTCDVLFKIPMAVDFDSLNVAQAGTVCLYEMARKVGKVS